MGQCACGGTSHRGDSSGDYNTGRHGCFAIMKEHKSSITDEEQPEAYEDLAVGEYEAHERQRKPMLSRVMP
ncbi:uncharacterized protein G2W53_020177 [Senna tora]|uniref:Uncharacterized protein n=1 Tax=Senna tora TaxID=362788 RepID=A0A834TVG9_9FABA|nr:uncharacterized protein G2W53_020177 [Senna tora]